jgi:hypothetical protein
VSLPRLLRWLLAVGLCALGIYLLLPPRNLFGNPADEQQLQRCTLADGAEIRLYQGNGGATTAFWYTVTHAKGWREPERQIFYAYGYPEIRAIACRPDAVVLTLADGFGERSESLSLARVHRELRHRPVTLSRGERLEGRGLRPASIGLGSLLLLTSLALALVPRWLARSVRG